MTKAGSVPTSVFSSNLLFCGQIQRQCEAGKPQLQRVAPYRISRMRMAWISLFFRKNRRTPFSATQVRFWGKERGKSESKMHVGRLIRSWQAWRGAHLPVL